MSGVGRRWEHFAHGADVGVRGIGATPAEAFAEAARALTAAVCDPDQVRRETRVDVACDAPDLPLLFVDWLQAIVYEMATRRMLFGGFEVSISGSTLHGRLAGERVDPARHEPAVEIKGVTHTALRVAQEPDGSWLAQCVVDV